VITGMGQLPFQLCTVSKLVVLEAVTNRDCSTSKLPFIMSLNPFFLRSASQNNMRIFIDFSPEGRLLFCSFLAGAYEQNFRRGLSAKGSDRMAAVQNGNAVLLPVKGPLPEQAAIRLAPAENSHFPPIVLDMPRHAAPCTNVVEGLIAAVRRGCSQRRLSAEGAWIADLVNSDFVKPNSCATLL